MLRVVRLISAGKMIKNVVIIGERRIKIELGTAIRHALDGNAILFLGAGFSIGRGANKINETLPNASKLSFQMCDELGIERSSRKQNIERETITATIPKYSIDNIEGAIVHMNGNIIKITPEKFYDEFKITNESYLKQGFLESP